MSGRKQKDKEPPKDPWDAPVKGTRDQGDGEGDTVRIPVEIVHDLVEASAHDPVPDPRDLHIADLELRLKGTERLLEQTRSAYRNREKELEAARERLERDREKHLERARVNLLERLFEPMDNLDRSLSSAADWSGLDERTEGLLDGLTMVRRQLRDRLEELGLERFEPLGELFDPNIHEALSVVPVKDREMDGKVVEVWEPGYRCGEVIIRAAKVVVGRKG
ncbi:MAG: nucleotide exchange factor GrpE [Pseudomonadota bacterium]